VPNRVLHGRSAREQTWPARLEPAASHDTAHATPFLATDCEVVAARLDAFLQSMDGIRPFFALGCNAARPVLATLAAGGAGFEIASVYEFDALRAIGADLSDVLFGSTVKPERHIRDSALQGVWRFALDSQGELLKIAAAAPGSAVYVRLDVKDSHTRSPVAPEFGTTADQALGLLRMAPEYGIRPYGLAFRVESQCMDPSVYARAIERCGLVMRRLEQFGTRLEMLNIGVARPAAYSEPVDNMRALADAVGPALARLPYRPKLLAAELGRLLLDESV
jgi:ornithine decarboxylase